MQYVVFILREIRAMNFGFCGKNSDLTLEDQIIRLTNRGLFVDDIYTDTFDGWIHLVSRLSPKDKIYVCKRDVFGLLRDFMDICIFLAVRNVHIYFVDEKICTNPKCSKSLYAFLVAINNPLPHKLRHHKSHSQSYYEDHYPIIKKIMEMHAKGIDMTTIGRIVNMTRQRVSTIIHDQIKLGHLEDWKSSFNTQVE